MKVPPAPPDLPGADAEPVGLLRPITHAAIGLFALALGVLPHPLAVAMSGVAVLAGFVLLPLTPLGARLRRPGEPFLGGLRTYPIALVALILFLPPGQAAAAWGVLAFGDAAAAVVGSRVPGPAVFGHEKATVPGSLAFVAFGFLGAFGLSAGAAAISHATPFREAFEAPGALPCLAAAAAGALADLLPHPREDNLKIPAAAALALVLAT